MSSGIYKFENKINHLCYIGQAKNLEERKYRHYRNFMNNRCDTDFYKAVYEFGINNFDYEILECGNFSQEELNDLEIKYISKYNSYYNGYNSTKGGHYIPAQNGPKKIDKVLLEKIKNDIKFTEITLSIIASKYKLAPSTISEINFGKIGFDKNEEYPLRKNATSISNRGQKNGRAIFSDKEVLEIRKKFVEMDLNQLYKQYKKEISFSALKKIVYGVHFTHLPIYKKKQKKWFLDGTCIDYPV